MDDENVPAKTPTYAVGHNIDALSVQELNQSIRVLEGEIDRLKAALAARGESRSAAESLFKF